MFRGVRAVGPRTLLLLRGAVDHGPVQPAPVTGLLVHRGGGGGRAVAHEVAEGVVHGRPEAERGHQAGRGVGRHEGQTAAVGRCCGVGQAQRAQAERRAQRVGARVGAEVAGVGLQRREGGPAAERAQRAGRHGPGQQGSVVRGRCGPGLQRSGQPGSPGGCSLHASGPRVLHRRGRAHRGFLQRRGGAQAGRQASAVVVEHLLNGLHHVAATALKHQLQDASPVAREDTRQDVQRRPLPRPRPAAQPWSRCGLGFFFVSFRARFRTQGAGGAGAVLLAATAGARAPRTAATRLLGGTGQRRPRKGLAISVLRA